MKHVAMFSSGAGSWAAARRVADEYGADNLILLFADVLGEDEDNYRFLVEAAAEIYGIRLPKSWRRLDGKPEIQREFAAEWVPGLVWLVEGRTIWDVFKDNRFLGNSRLANCSKFLKQQPAREWLDANCDPADTTVYVGIDWTEIHRLPAIERSYQPYTAKAPLTEAPYLNRDQVLGMLRRRGIEPPRLYGLGFAHANCGGGCVRAGQGQFATLLKQMPDRFAEWERNEQELREHLGRDDIAILKDRTREGILAHLGITEADVEKVKVEEGYWSTDDWGAPEWQPPDVVEVVKATGEPLPKMVPLTLSVLRERAEVKPEQLDLLDIGGCGCFVAEEVTE